MSRVSERCDFWTSQPSTGVFLGPIWVLSLRYELLTLKRHKAAGEPSNRPELRREQKSHKRGAEKGGRPHQSTQSRHLPKEKLSLLQANHNSKPFPPNMLKSKKHLLCFACSLACRLACLPGAGGDPTIIFIWTYLNALKGVKLVGKELYPQLRAVACVGCRIGVLWRDVQPAKAVVMLFSSSFFFGGGVLCFRGVF